MDAKRKYEIRRAVDTAIMVIVVFILVIVLWALLDAVAGAQGEYWYLTTHYRWEWLGGRWARVAYPVVCSGYICRPACHNYYGGWGPCY